MTIDRTRTTLVALLSLAVTAVAAHALTESDEIIQRGEYRFTYFGKSLGRETFTIARHEGGYRIRATLSLDIDDQVPSEGVYELDANRRLLRAEYRELIEGGARAEYAVDGDRLLIRGTGGPASGERSIALPPGSVITGPHYVTDFFVLEPLALEVGDRREQVAYTFGFEGWEPTRVNLSSTRERDRTIKDATGAKVDTVVYRCEIKTTERTFKTRSWLNDAGVSQRITVGAAIGSMNVRLQ